MTMHRTRREVLAASPAVALGTLGGTSTAALARAEDSDSELLRMGQQWSACRERLSAYQDRWDENRASLSGEDLARSYPVFAEAEMALYGEVYAVQDRIIGTPARTLAGMQLKARVVAEDHAGNIYGTSLAALECMLADPEIKDGRAGLSLAADILRLAKKS